VKTNLNPQELVVELLKRSTCSVQVAAVLADKHGVFSWGWNSSGPTGMGEHAEAMCMRRANPARVPLATLYVAARRRKSRRAVLACPCVACARIVLKCAYVCYREKSGKWVKVQADWSK
jgi:deoxycytidylate deaminase